MLYQKILTGFSPYFVFLHKVGRFESHRHHEIEISVCLEGSYTIICEGNVYTLNEGDFAIIPSMATHSIPSQEATSTRALTIELGYVFLGEYFENFLNHSENCIVIQKNEFSSHWTYCELFECLKQTALLKEDSDVPFVELIIKSNLYKISALLFQLFNECNIAHIPTKRTEDVKKIDLALEAIYNRYSEPLNINTISAMCGYSKSNFCKIFKKITGDTFHNALNIRRVEMACILLSETNDTVEEIACKTGFGDSKSFCRVFKNIMNLTAGEYRKKIDI